MGNASFCQWVGMTLIIGVVGGAIGTKAAAQQAPVSAEPTIAAPAGAAPTLVAQYYDGSVERPYVEPLPTIPDKFNDAFYSHNGNFFDNRGIRESFRLIFGIPHYVENAIYLDGQSVDRLYREVLDQQVASDPVLRTPDLPSPYTGSVLTTPLVISEDPIQPAPLFPPVRRPPTAPPAPGDAGTTRPAPVPALW
jgi:hypothetical protein